MADSPNPDFGGFYTATASRVVGYPSVVLGDLAEAEDAAHEAYARAWQRWTKVREYDDPEAYFVVKGTHVAQLTIIFTNHNTTTTGDAHAILTQMAANLP